MSRPSALSDWAVYVGIEPAGGRQWKDHGFFVTETLASQLRPGEIVFMDNCSIHKVEEVTEAIEAFGADA